jgi:hypothetical protein
MTAIIFSLATGRRIMLRRFTSWLIGSLLLVAILPVNASAQNFKPIDSITSSTAATDLWPVSNLILGPGVGFDANPPHDKLLAGPVGNWVTAAPGGFPSDYITVAGTPVLVLDLGADVPLFEISVWGYASENANGVSDFKLRFATAAEGPGGFGASIAFNPQFFPSNNSTSRQSFPFGQVVVARYVEFTALDNFFIAPGDGSGGETPGGDRVGLGEIAFEDAGRVAIPIPASSVASRAGLVIALLLIGSLILARRRRLATEFC